MGSFDWNKMLAKDLAERILDKQKNLEELKQRKREEFERNVKI